MANETPIFLQAGSHTAEAVRRAFISTISDGYEGVIGSPSFEVTQNSLGADMSVDVAVGRAIIQGDEDTSQGAYIVERTDAKANVAISASHPSLARKDIVVARVKDTQYSGASDTFSIEAITGTADAVPVAPTVPDNAILLATIDVAALASTVVTANITDGRRLFATDGWETWTPSSLGAWTIGNGIVTARFKKWGATVDIDVSITSGSTTTEADDLVVSLPPTAIPSTAMVDAGHTNFYTQARHGFVGVAVDSSTSTYYPVGGQLQASAFKPMALVLGVLGTDGLTATVPFTWATGDYVGFSIRYESDQ